MKSKNIAIGVLGGLAVGALLGVLFAPDKGTKTRKKIAAKGSDLKDSFESNMSNLADTIQSKYDEVASKFDKTIDEVKAEVKAKKL